jgi:hypothetical protein
VLPPAPTSAPVEYPESPSEPGLPLALIAFTVAGVALVVSQVPYGRFATVALAGLGGLVALAGLCFTEKGRLLPGTAAVLNAVVFLVALVLPGWIGADSWHPATVAEDSQKVKAIRHDHGVPVVADWVDVSQASWQLDDVRISVRGAWIGPVELTGTNTQKRATKERYLQLWINVINAGVARRVEFQGWSVTPAEPGGPVPHLTDPTGKQLAAKTFPRGTSAAWLAEPVGLFPGKSVDELVVFELPDPNAAFLRLELPGSAFGGTEPVHLHIPRTFLNSRFLF